jgi:SAM-dependent methyltransferase
MSQNIYDDPEFFAAYATLPRSQHGLDAAPEWPSLRAMLPDVRERRVVDLGCGYGWFCRWAAAQGAAEVLGIDLSERMLARAADEPHERITYERQDLEMLELPEATFDVAYSSLTLHYVVDLERMLAVVRRSLATGGAFVCSVEHPIFTAPSSPQFVEQPDGHTVWPLDGYLAEGPRRTNWLADGVVKQHRTIGTYLALLQRMGFRLEQLIEWGPNDMDLAAHPEWANEVHRPAFMLLAAEAA